MRELLLGLAFGQSVLYVLQKIFIKNAIFQVLVVRLFMAFWSWLGLEIWLMYRGFGDFLSFQIFPFIACLLVPWLLHVISLRVGGVQVNMETLFPVESFRLKGKNKQLFVRDCLHSAYMAIYEELHVRWFLFNALYELTQSVETSVLASALLFCVMQLKRHPTSEQAFDAVLFTAVLTFLYLWSCQLIFCIILHVLCNQLRITQKYVARIIES